MGIREYRMRLVLGALLRPDSVGHWLTEQIRMRRNQWPEFRLESDHLEIESAPEFVASVTRKGRPTDQLLSEVDDLYHRLESQVNDFYRYDGQGRSPSAIDNEDARILYSICRLTRPSLVIETGVSDGISSAVFLAALNANNFGRLVSIDFPIVGVPRLYGKSPGWVVPQVLRNRWTLLTGQSRTLLPMILSERGPLDLFFHDSEHSYECMRMEFELSMRHLSPGGVVVSDDAWVSDALRDATVSALGAGHSVVYSPNGLGGVRPSPSSDTRPEGALPLWGLPGQ